MRTEALAEEAEGIALLHDRAGALPDEPLDLNPFLSFLDEKVGGFVSSSRFNTSCSMKSKIQDGMPVMESASVLHLSFYQGVSGVSSVSSARRIPDRALASVLHPSSYQDASGVSSVSPRNQVDGDSGFPEALSPEIYIHHF